MQAAVHYVAMTPEGRIFDNSLMKGSPYYIRIGSGAVRAQRRRMPPLSQHSAERVLPPPASH